MPMAALFSHPCWNRLKPVRSSWARDISKEAVQVARAAGVPCESTSSSPATVYRGIIDAAKKSKCDVIFMASHRRGEVASAVLGSVTLKVLAHSKIPVMVFR